MQIPIKLLEDQERMFAMSPHKMAVALDEINTKFAPDLDSSDYLMKRMKMLKKVATESFDDALERYIGNNNLLPINFLEIG